MRKGTRLMAFAAILIGAALGYLAASGQLRSLTQAQAQAPPRGQAAAEVKADPHGKMVEKWCQFIFPARKWSS